MSKPWSTVTNAWRYHMRGASHENAQAQTRVCKWLCEHGDPPQLAAVDEEFCGIQDTLGRACLREDGHTGPHCSAYSEGRWYWVILDIWYA